MKNKDNTISNDGTVAEEFGSFFEMQFNPWISLQGIYLTLGDTTNLSSPVEIAIRKFENHPSVQIIQEDICVDQEFDFEQVRGHRFITSTKNY